MKLLLKFFIVLLFSSALIACSSGGGGGDDAEEAKITAANEEDLGTAATEGTKQALDGSNAPGGLRAQPGIRTVLDTLSESISKRYSNKLAFIITDVSSICTGGGTATADSNSSGTNIVITYVECDTGPAIADGVAHVTSSTSGNITTTTIEYVDFTITIGSDVTTIDLEATCTFNSSTSEVNCSYSSDVSGIDGRTYSVSGSTISGNSSSGYTISATVTDPDHGSFSITTTIPILFNCPSGQPSSGEIQFFDGDDVLVTVTFNDCTSFTISYSGTSTVYTW